MSPTSTAAPRATSSPFIRAALLHTDERSRHGDADPPARRAGPRVEHRPALAVRHRLEEVPCQVASEPIEPHVDLGAHLVGPDGPELLEGLTDGSEDFGPCACCGDRSRRVWGFVHRGEATEAAYGVHWTLGKVPEYGAHVDLTLGRWGEGAERADRYAVSLEFRQGAGVMVIDASERDIARSELVGRALRRNEVIGTPLARRVFDLIDAIWLQDGRIAEVTGLAP